jgi:hypothetical protein
VNCGTYLSPALDDLRSLIDKWVYFTAKAIDCFHCKGNYQHIELMYGSLLSSAAWSCDAVSAIEVPALKQMNTGPSRGHIDLMICPPTGRKVAIEFKREFVNHPEGWEKLLGILEDAEAEVKYIPSDLAQRRSESRIGSGSPSL